MEVVIDLLSWAFLLGGAFFMVTSGVGVLRLPDVFTRMHAAGVKDTMGVALTMTGLILQAGFSLISAKLLIIWIFLWFASPIVSHATARAALLGGVKPILAKRGSEDPESAAEAARRDISQREGEPQ